MTPPLIPRATYRLQLNKDFTFADAEALVPYLNDLGISHLYVSPFLKARPGSMHGYDIIDHNALNPEIGDRAAFDRLTDALARHGMGLILDFVPNHMGIGGSDNDQWLDVLEWGQSSPYAVHFDIDWQPARPELRGRVLLPFLGDHYGAILEAGELTPKFDRAAGSLGVWYWNHLYPLNPLNYPDILTPALAELEDDPAGEVLEDIILMARAMLTMRITPRTMDARRRLAAEVKHRLAELTANSPEAGEAIDYALERLHKDPAALHKLLEQQAYRLSFWRVAGDEINYRRFFDINDLAGLRMEEPDLFARAHRFVFELLAEGKIQGLRIDHIDGLYNPAEYCQRLQAKAREIRGSADEQPLYLLVEKILAPHEPIRRDWPVAGTTGYDFMNLVNSLFVDGETEEQLSRIYRRFIFETMDFDLQVYHAKKLIMESSMASELNVLAVELGRIAASHWRSRDFTLWGLRHALKEVVACFPVYRTYVTPRRVTENDIRYIDWAVGLARKMAGGDMTVFDFLHQVLTTQLVRGEAATGYSRRAVIDFTMSVQQYTGPVMAKGFEDTAFYRFNRLISLNEVGGEPRRFGIGPAAFHQANRNRLKTHPHAMLATATHDAKRGEDVRPRIDILSEIPEDWRNRATRWAQLNQSFKRDIDGWPAPEPNDEYFLYQTMLGAWPNSPHDMPDFVERLVQASIKAVREAKRRTSWQQINEPYEQALCDFIRRICETDRRNPFLDDFRPFQERVARIGMVGGLAQTLLKLTAPGVPDIYQGCELWQLALVDPDNRRPVDYDLRREMLAAVHAADPQELLAAWTDGAIKLHLTRAVLALRRRHPGLFAEGSYEPLEVRGERAAHVCAFARMQGGQALAVAVPRLLARLWRDNDPLPPLGDAWRGVHVAPPRKAGQGPWRNLLTGEDIHPVTRRGAPVFAGTDLFARFPVALLHLS